MSNLPQYNFIIGDSETIKFYKEDPEQLISQLKHGQINWHWSMIKTESYSTILVTASFFGKEIGVDFCNIDIDFYNRLCKIEKEMTEEFNRRIKIGIPTQLFAYYDTSGEPCRPTIEDYERIKGQRV